MQNDIVNHDTSFDRNSFALHRLPMSVGKRIAAARRGKYTQTQLAEALGVSQSTVASWESNTNEPSISAIERIAALTDASEQWIAFAKQPDIELEGDNVAQVDVRGGLGAGGINTEEFETTDREGNTVSADAVSGMWRFPAGYLRTELKAAVKKAVILEVQGDSMEPTLHNGDRVMIDTAQQQVSHGIFAIWNGIEVTVKRLQYIPKTDPLQIKIISDNPKHDVDILTIEEMKIIGRAVWFSRRM